MSTLNQTLDTLVQSFQEYKDDNTKQLKALEEKSQMRDNIQLSQQRPQLDNNENNTSHCEYKNAFTKYMRSGDTNAANYLEYKSLSTLSESDGGYLIPQVIRQNIQKSLKDLSPIRRLASIMQISSNSVDVLLEKSGASVGWVGEIDDRDETDTPKIHKHNIAVHEIYAKPKATQKLLDDAIINVEDWIVRSVSQKIAENENIAFLYGDGNKKPRGILSYESADASEWGKFAHIEHDQADNNAGLTNLLLDMYTGLKEEFLSNARWLMSRATLAEIRKLKSNDGRHIWQPSMAEKCPSSLFGHEVEICDLLPTLGTDGKISILFGDFARCYQIVDRQGVQVLRDPYSSKPYVEFYTTKRVGADVVNFDALIALKTSTNPTE